MIDWYSGMFAGVYITLEMIIKFSSASVILLSNNTNEWKHFFVFNTFGNVTRHYNTTHSAICTTPHSHTPYLCVRVGSCVLCLHDIAHAERTTPNHRKSTPTRTSHAHRHYDQRH